MKHPVRTTFRLFFSAILLATVVFLVWVAILNNTWVPMHLPSWAHGWLGKKDYDLWLPGLLILAWLSVFLFVLMCRSALLTVVRNKRRKHWAKQLDQDAPASQ